MSLSPNGAYDAEGRRKYLTKAEGHAFLKEASSLPQPQALFCQTIYYTGCRISEALGLRKQDVDSAMRTLLIRSLKKRDRNVVRRIPIPDFLVRDLGALGTASSRELFWGYSRTTGWRLIKAVMHTARISGIHATPKGLRHGFGVRGAMVQIPINVIQNWMGHADSSTTAIYLAVKDEEERALIQKTW